MVSYHDLQLALSRLHLTTEIPGCTTVPEERNASNDEAGDSSLPPLKKTNTAETRPGLPSSPSSLSPSPFLTLPSEIRLQIYRFLFSAPFRHKPLLPQGGLLLVCRQLYDEALPVLYAQPHIFHLFSTLVPATRRHVRRRAHGLEPGWVISRCQKETPCLASRYRDSDCTLDANSSSSSSSASSSGGRLRRGVIPPGTLVRLRHVTLQVPWALRDDVLDGDLDVDDEVLVEMYKGLREVMAELASGSLETEEEEEQRLWRLEVQTRVYISGGIGVGRGLVPGDLTDPKEMMEWALRPLVRLGPEVKVLVTGRLEALCVGFEKARRSELREMRREEEYAMALVGW